MWRSISNKVLWALLFMAATVAVTPSATQINLATQVKGILAVANGGTGVSSAQGNGSKIQLSTGSTTTNNCVKFDANGNTVDAGAACGGSGSGTVNNCTTADALAYYAATGTTVDCLSSVGTSGQVLTSNGAGVAPSFQASTGAPTSATYVTCTSNGSLSANTIFFDLCHGPDVPPSSANALDDEMNAAAGGVNTSLWTWVNQGGATANYSGTGYLDFIAPANSGVNLRMLVQTLPSAPYTFKAKIECAAKLSNFHICGLALRESGTSKVVVVATQSQGSSPWHYTLVLTYTNSTTFSTARFNPTVPLPDDLYFQINRTGTTLTYSTCAGTACTILYSSTLTADFTTAPDQIVLLTDSEDSGSTCEGIIWWFRRTV